MYADAIEMIKSAAIREGFNQFELAEKSNISPSQISRIFSFKSTASPENLVSLAIAVKLPADEILRMAGKLPKDPAVDVMAKTITHLMQSLPPEDKHEVLEFVRMKVRLAESKSNGHSRRSRPSESG